MITKHTPGPWHVANGVQIRSDKHQIAKVWMMRSGEGNANARLIAAAPMLMAALQFLLDCSAPMTSQQEECWKAAKTALDLAEKSE